MGTDDLATLREYRTELLRVRYAGAATISMRGRTTTFRSEAEIATALADLERRIAALEGTPVRRVRISSSKGT